MEHNEKCQCEGKKKNTPRSAKTIKNLEDRLSRAIGQLNGIKKMIEENRYCGDILIQLSAVKKAIESMSYQILKEHFETCLIEEIKNGNSEVVEELFTTIKNIK